jgi:hypothetical protein
MENDTVMTLIAFGGWVCLLMFALIVAGFIADRARDRYNKQRGAYDEDLDRVIREDREARGKHLTADEVLRRSRAA